MTAANTLRARLTFWYVGALLVALSAFAVLLYAWLGRTLYRHHDAELLATSGRIAQLLADVPLEESAVAAALRTIDPSPRLLMVRNDRGDLIYRSPLLQVAEPSIGHHEALIHAAANGPRDPEFFTVVLERSGPVRFICTPIERSRAGYVQIGNALGDVPTTMRSVALASAVLVPIVVVLTSFGGWLIAGRALRPIGDIDATLRAIEATDLSRRVEVHPTDRELSGLVGTVNGLLSRLERAFKDLGDFTADASHQLKTPLTLMKSRIELARRQEPALFPALLEDIDLEIDEMSAVVSELQALSLIDADDQRSARRDVDLSRLCDEATEILEALGEARGVSVVTDIAAALVTRGNPITLKQLVLNVGDNAIKYTPAGGHVTIELREDVGFATLRISDTGVGISPEQLPHIFDRFFRGPGEAGTARGTGLGLAIAKRITEIHGGTIDATSQLGAGTTLSVRLPLV